MPTSPKLEEVDYLQFLLAAQAAFSCVQAAWRPPGAQGEPPAHDAYTRLLLRRPPDTEALWQQTQPFVIKGSGLLVRDESPRDKPHAPQMARVPNPWSGKPPKSVLGINLITRLGTEGAATLPIDCRVSNAPVEGVDKNQPFRGRLATAKQRGLTPR
jgi:hypothetical protein